jgi:hypothetical protein
MKYFFRNIEDRLSAFIDRHLNYVLEKKRFKRAHGYDLNLEQPMSFNEKICWKKIYDRNPLLPIAADKFQVRKYVSDTLGEEASNILIPLIQVAESADQLDFDHYPEQFVVKSNHGSGHVIIVKNKDQADKAAIIKKANDWLTHNHGHKKHEWAYNEFPRKLIVEKLILDEHNNVPEDYKFSMIHGKCVFIQVDRDRFENFTRSIFDPDWNHLDIKWKRKKGPAIEKPENLQLMLNIAEKLAKPFDYIRVDLYSLGKGEVYFGELTNYPVSGRGKFTPKEFDFELGKLWKLPNQNLRQ